MNPSELPAVLYVDDDALNLRVFDANFGQRFRIFRSSSPSEALALLEQRRGEIGVILSDQRMPGMTGVELLERARTIAPDAKRMLVTAYADMQAVIDAVNRGQVTRYFVKPWDRTELQAALDDALKIARLELRIREVEGRMLKSERLATLGQVTAGIAHELMGPVGYLSQNVRVTFGPVKLCQVLLNLIVNAAQAMGTTGRPGRIEVRWTTTPDDVVLTVADNGCGIPMEQQERVFQPMFTTKPVGVGTGLGLSICRELVTQFGGSLRLSSTQGEGTEIEITLRRAPPP